MKEQVNSNVLITCLTAFVLFYCQGVYSQALSRVDNSAYTDMNACSAEPDVFSFTGNQASLAQISGLSAGIGQERKFLLPELTNYRAVLAMPTPSGNFGIAAARFGFSDFKQTELGLAYARKMGDRVAIGVQFNYTSIAIPGYGKAGATSFEIGAILPVTDKLRAAIHFDNPAGGKFRNVQGIKLSSVYTAGLGYEASDRFFISVAIGKEEAQPITVNAGIQYKVAERVLLRGGVATANSSLWFGAGLCWKRFRFDAITYDHPRLGMTPGLLLLYSLKENQQKKKNGIQDE